MKVSGENEIRWSLSDSFIATILDSYKITNIKDTIYVQRQVLSTLIDERFFTDSLSRSRTDINEKTGLVIETNKSGIDETFSFNNFARLSKLKK